MEHRTNRGKTINFDELRKTADASKRAIGNMNVDAHGNVLDKDGNIVKTNAERVREHHATTTSKTLKKSLKTDLVDKQEADSTPLVDVPTARTAAENVRTEEHRSPLGENFDEGMEPLGHNEQIMPNGDIVVTPYYRPEDKIEK